MVRSYRSSRVLRRRAGEVDAVWRQDNDTDGSSHVAIRKLGPQGQHFLGTFDIDATGAPRIGAPVVTK